MTPKLVLLPISAAILLSGINADTCIGADTIIVPVSLPHTSIMCYRYSVWFVLTLTRISDNQ